MQCSVFIATSLDGFISRENGNIDWLNEANKKIPKGEDCGYAKFMASTDAIVMGRNTFEQVLGFPEWPYKIPSIVLSRSLKELPNNIPENVSLSHATPTELVHALATESTQQLYIDGGKTIQSFLAAKLITDITITVVPVLLGTGKSLFGALAKDVQLKHVSTHAYEFGFVQSKYHVV